MNALPPVLLTALALGSTLAAQQGPSNPPPWWFANDNNTVTVGWEFNVPFASGQPIAPTFENGPNWYTGSTIRASSQIGWQGTLTNHFGVLATTSQAAVQVEADIANDPRPNWIKVMWLQYDVYTDGGRIEESEIAPDLANYLRHNVAVDESPLGQNWSRVTVDAVLKPQPVGEEFLWEFAPSQGLAALDNIYVSTRCIPTDNEMPDGEAMGEPTGVSVDDTAATGNDAARGCAYHRNTAGQELFWVSATAQTGVTRHEFYGFDANTGALVASLSQNLSVVDSATGLLDLATVERGAPSRDRIYGVFRNGQGLPELRAFDPNSQTWDTAGQFAVTALAGIVPRGLAFNPDGNLGAGTLWITDGAGNAHEVTLQGLLLRSTPTGLADISGAGYDPIRGSLYFFSRDGSANPTPVTAVGTVFDVATLQPTGERFYGDLNVNAARTGGRSLGFDFFRRPGPRFPRMVCLADDTAGSDILYELGATYRFGFSCFGNISMNSSVPWLGNPSWGVTTTGAPPQSLGFLYAGFSKTMAPGGTPLPLILANVGLPECAVLQSTELTLGAAAVGPGGSATLNVPLPVNPALSYTPVHFQWVYVGTDVPGGLASSPAGKTVLY